jgi:hypothetical protein
MKNSQNPKSVNETEDCVDGIMEPCQICVTFKIIIENVNVDKKNLDFIDY